MLIESNVPLNNGADSRIAAPNGAYRRGVPTAQDSMGVPA